MGNVISVVFLILMGLLGGIPTIAITISIPIIFGWKIYRKIKFGYSIYR